MSKHSQPATTPLYRLEDRHGNVHTGLTYGEAKSRMMAANRELDRR